LTKKIIFFSIDRLGDYLIRSNVIKKLSSLYDYSEIICSDRNYKLISNQSFFNKVNLFDTNNKILNKLLFFKKYFLKKYHTAISFDGKSISYILIFFIRAKNKHVFLYKKKGIYNYILLKIIVCIYYLFRINFIFLNSKKIIENSNGDNYPKKYKAIENFYPVSVDNEIYYLEKIEKNFFSNIKNQYILIHLDEKFIDIIDIEENLKDALLNTKKYINKKIILTSFNNFFDYYKNLNLIKKKINEINSKILIESEILIIEDVSIKDFQILIENSFCNISCHAGYFVHTSLALKKKTIDIINEKDKKWLETWLYKPNNYKIIFKSNEKYLKKINEIFLEIAYEINK
tara:strand:+ start:5067 stop:6101 length:1035 start_codon:yes stop_codon:yes gene_type:complete